MLGEKLLALRKKCGYSQQELAEKLAVTRQTISNWECGQGAPALDKAQELAELYQISLDDLTSDHVEIVTGRTKVPESRILKQLEGSVVRLSGSDEDLFWDLSSGTGGAKLRVLKVSGEWVRVEYVKPCENRLFQKETVVKLIDPRTIQGIEILEEGV